MKVFLVFAFTLFFCGNSFSQSKITINVNGKHDEILGYTMDPDGTGNKQSISLFGGMQNLTSALQMSYLGASPINTMIISITGANVADNALITLSNVTVYALKQYASNYTNGTFVISTTGNINTEIKCKFQKLMIEQSGSNKVPITDPGSLIMENKAVQKWEIQMDSSVTGIGGKVTLQLPKGESYSTHIKFYQAGDTKKIVASWFGNNHANLLPGLYDVVVDDEYTIKNVPVEAGKQTRLKMGIFKVSNYGTIQIESSDHQKFSAGGPFSKLLPEGTYYINGRKENPVVIKDRTVTKL